MGTAGNLGDEESPENMGGTVHNNKLMLDIFVVLIRSTYSIY